MASGKVISWLRARISFLSWQQRQTSHWKYNIQHKQQSTREYTGKEISSSIGDQNISVKDDICIDLVNDRETNLNSDVECEGINDVNDKDNDDDDEECNINDINEGT